MAENRVCLAMSENRMFSPKPPLIPGTFANYASCNRLFRHRCCVPVELTVNLGDRLFAEGYLADVCVYTNEGIIPAHASILGMTSPVMKSMLKQSKKRGSLRRTIFIRGVPHHAVWVFLRFLYSSCYEQEEMKSYVLHLLVLSHVFVIPSLKKVCMQQLERGLLNIENVVDVFQLAQLCDTPRLLLLCHRMIMKSFMAVAATEGWKVMKQSNPRLEKELLESVIDADSKKERLKKVEERKIYLQLHEAMEALVHICRDGCRTIGPHDKVLKRSAEPCEFPACKGLESLVRHFAGCKNRVLGGCTHCKRMWQLLELHSRLCSDQVHGCKVPLCSHFKDRTSHQNRKDEVKWKLLVSKVLEAKTVTEERCIPSVIAISA